MAPKVLFLIEDGFEDLELFYPMYRLMEEGFEVVIASSSPNEKVGKYGYRIKPHKTFDDVKPEEYSALVIPGGKSPERVRINEKAVSITKHFVNENKVIAAICHGPQLLISAGAVKDKKLTCWIGIRDDVMAAGGIYEDRVVVVDGNLITSRMPSDLPAFCRELVEKLRHS
ncbi:MAG: peptidase [Archaeoglobales archaeon]|nr:MAG: peptidase [Archaeoglobales archaeon]